MIIIRRYRQASILALTALLAFSCVDPTAAHLPVYDPDRIIDTGSTGKEDAGLFVTLATYNVEGFDLGESSPAGTYSGIAAALKNASVEIATFEEVQPEDVSALQIALGSIACNLPYITCSTKSDGYNSFAVASAFPILSAIEVLPPSGTTWPRCVYQVRVDVGQGLTLYVCHLKSGSDAASLAKRKAQARALASYLRDYHGDGILTESIVILGDMNTMNPEDRSGSGNTVNSLELEDDADAGNDFISLTDSILPSVDAYTWEGPVNSVWTRSSLDHLVLSKGARARYVDSSLKIWRTDPSVTMAANSDHYPVLIDISL